MAEPEEEFRLLEKDEWTVTPGPFGDEDEGAVVPEKSNGASHGKIKPMLLLTIFAACLGGSFINGYNLAAMNSPESYIRAFMNASLQRYTSQSSESTLTAVWSITVALFIFSGCIGAMNGSLLAETFGRRNGLMVSQIGSILSVPFFALAVRSQLFELLMVGRLLAGWSAGAGMSLVPLYLTELSPLNLRGMVGCTFTLGVVVGVFFAELFGLNYLLGTESRWPILLSLTGLPNVISCALLPFCPESPIFLLAKRSDVIAARQALQQIREQRDVAKALDEISRECDEQRSSGEWSILRLLSTSELRLPLALVCVSNLAQQYSGINAVNCYSEQIFAAVKIPLSASQYAVLGTGALLIVCNLVTMVLIERAGRRLLLLVSVGGVVLLMVLIAVSVVLQSSVPWMAYCSVALVFLFIIVFCIGASSIPCFLAAEMFGVGSRAPASSIAALCNWLANFSVVVSFPFLQMSIGGYSFLIFAGISAVLFAFLYAKLPETKQRSLSEIYEALYSM